MIPRYLMDYLKLLLELTVILMFVFSTSSIKQCGPKTIVTIRNVGIKLCQLKCTEHGICGSSEYDIETLTCRLSRDDLKKTEKKEGDMSFSKTFSVVPNCSCASMTCNLEQRCLKTRSGKAVCVQDMLNNIATLL